jgi:hypothetical protein
MRSGRKGIQGVSLTSQGVSTPLSRTNPVLSPVPPGHVLTNPVPSSAGRATCWQPGSSTQQAGLAAKNFGSSTRSAGSDTENPKLPHFARISRRACTYIDEG